MSKNKLAIDDDIILNNHKFNYMDIDKTYDKYLTPEVEDLSYLDNAYELEYNKLLNPDTHNYENDYSYQTLRNIEKLKKQLGIKTEKEELLDRIDKLINKT